MSLAPPPETLVGTSGCPSASGRCDLATIVEVACRPPYSDPRATTLLAQVCRHGAAQVTHLELRRLFLVVATELASAFSSTADTLDELLPLLHDPFLHTIDTAVAPGLPLAATEADWCIDITYRPGVLDPEGDGVGAWWTSHHAEERRLVLHTGYRYLLTGALQRAEVEQVATDILYNPLIQRATITPLRGEHGGCPVRPWLAVQTSTTTTPTSDEEAAAALVESVPLDGLDESALLALSTARHLALTAHELRTVQAYFADSGRAPTDVELESIALAWSEHCCHKTFRGPIDYTEVSQDGRSRTVRIDGLLSETIMKATRQLDLPWVRSAFVGNAGIIAFDEHYDLALKVETHNHPSAIEPFGGANTGVGGVIRDVLAAAARPIAVTDVLCFGYPDGDDRDRPGGVLAPERVAAGVVAGVADYGNKMGVPVVSGAVLFDQGYAANPLVFCGCLGLAPVDRRSESPQPGDLVVVIGGRTGRDGVHGATFSSGDLDSAAAATLGSVVQIGEPIVEKRVADALERLGAQHLYRAMTDCGAGGFCSAIGELGEGTGVQVELSAAPLKYPGLRPWEIWLSESQERMVLAVCPDDLAALQQILHEEGVDGAVVGAFTDDRALRVLHRGQLVAELPMTFLHDGRPRIPLRALWHEPLPPRSSVAGAHAATAASVALDTTLLQLLSHPTIASKAAIVRRYDHEVQGATVHGPLDGFGPSDAAVLAPVAGSSRGVAVAVGINPWYGGLDPYQAALLIVEETLRNLVAVGGEPDRTALLDNFAWGNPNRPEQLGALVRAARGCHDAAVALGVPFVSGKDSLYNEYRDPDGVAHAIPGTLLITGVALVEEVTRVPGTALRRPGARLYLIGRTTPELGGSHLALVDPRLAGDTLPGIDLARSRATLQAMAQAIRLDLLHACHDLSEGGLGVALAEMAMGGGYGLNVTLPPDPSLPSLVSLFSETPSRFVVAVAPDRAERLEQVFAGLPLTQIGTVSGDDHFVVRDGQTTLIDLPVDALRAAWQTSLGSAFDDTVREGASGGSR